MENHWRQIQVNISRAIDEDFFIEKRTRISGGDINQTFHIGDKRKQFFVKLNANNAAEMFEAEALGLQELSATGAIRVPKVICFGCTENTSFLVLEYLSLGQAEDMAYLGKQLACMHQQTQDSFGFSQDNFIGLTRQPNHETKNWIEFFTKYRLEYQLGLLEDKGLRTKLVDSGRELIEMIDKFFVGYSPQPALIHGDLWQGNWGFLFDGTPVIYDPACYYADHEAELAMMELFGNLDVEFFDAYSKAYPIHKGYQTRKGLYNLYHLLNHANLFGGHYVTQSERLVERLLGC